MKNNTPNKESSLEERLCFAIENKFGKEYGTDSQSSY